MRVLLPRSDTDDLPSRRPPASFPRHKQPAPEEDSATTTFLAGAFSVDLGRPQNGVLHQQCTVSSNGSGKH
jgi:hypothetical protein